MRVKYKKKEWDSNFFKFNIAEARIENFDKSNYQSLRSIFSSEKFDLVYLYSTDKKSKESLIESKVPLVDNKITFFKKIGQNNIDCAKEIKSYVLDEHYSKLLELALASGEYSRFKLDKKFRDIEFKKLYTAWLENSLNKNIADEILVWRHIEKEILGFITYKIKGKALKIGLIAVDAKARGKGIGKKLLNCVEYTALNKIIKDILVETQEANSGACKFYYDNGYNIKRIQPIFHLWLSR